MLPRPAGASVVLAYLNTILTRVVSVFATTATSARRSTYCETLMETDNSTLRAQREALRAFLAAQERRKDMEAPVGPDRKKAEETVRQQADAGRRKVDEDRRGLDKLQTELTATADGMMQSVNQSWSEVKSALSDADLTRLLSDPASFRLEPDNSGNHAQGLRRCQTNATEAQEAVQRALIALREHNDRRRLVVFVGIAVCVIVVVLVIKLG